MYSDVHIHVEKRNLPSEFGGDHGPMDNRDFLQALHGLEDYFRQVRNMPDMRNI